MKSDFQMTINKNQGITVLDLFCGAGGFSTGFQQAGFDVVAGIDNWDDALRTHETNRLGESLKIDLLKIEINQILGLKKYLESNYGTIDVLIGSPPCTEFSSSKNGGKGNIEKGMLLVRKYLLFVAIFKPKFWVMENAPRLESVLNKECTGSKEMGWTIPYEKLGIPPSKFVELKLEGESLRIPRGNFFFASDFGAHQIRKRFMAGDFPIERMAAEKIKGGDTSLGVLLQTLKNGFEKSVNGYLNDPNYPCLEIKVIDLRDYSYNTYLHPMYGESIRHFKRRHIQYGQMHLPEQLNMPARTVLAVYFPVSREALVFDTEKQIMYHGKQRAIFRQPKVREVACIQGFPLNFQLAANRIEDRYKLVGNAVPCQLSFAIAKTVSNEIKERPMKIQDENFFERANVTLSRQKENDDRPLLSVPKDIVNEAVNIHKSNKDFSDFGAKTTKRIRRKVLSSKIEGNSCETIFENIILQDEKLQGGASWKVCLQKSKGNPYHQIYLDENSIYQIVNSLDASIDVRRTKNLAENLIAESAKGIPLLRSDWKEFPGWNNSPETYLSFITERRARLPSVTMFQKLFTENLEEIGEFISPIDFFDGLDSIMLLVFSKEEFKDLQTRLVHVDLIKDSGQYPQRQDMKIITQLANVNVPLVTIMSCFLSVNVLDIMYENDGLTEEYSSSLRAAKCFISKWCNS